MVAMVGIMVGIMEIGEITTAIITAAGVRDLGLVEQVFI
jgi:hypothetical protein